MIVANLGVADLACQFMSLFFGNCGTSGHFERSREIRLTCMQELIAPGDPAGDSQGRAARTRISPLRFAPVEMTDKAASAESQEPSCIEDIPGDVVAGWPDVAYNRLRQCGVPPVEQRRSSIRNLCSRKRDWKIANGQEG